MKTIDVKRASFRILTGLFLLLSCFFMYDGYKCLAAGIVTSFHELLVVLPMVLSYLLPVVCFCFFFYDAFVKELPKMVKTVYSATVACLSAGLLVLVSLEMERHVSNHALGAYDSLPGLGFGFPYDVLVVLSALLLWQVFSLALGNREGTQAKAVLDSLKERGTVSLGVLPYIGLSFFALVACFFVGASITAAFTAFEYVMQDGRFLFLLLWLLAVPMANLVLLVARPEERALSRRGKLWLLGGGIGINVLFAALFVLFELTAPNFLVHVGKPLCPLAFAASLPIEPALAFLLMTVGTVILTLRLVRVARDGVTSKEQ